MRNESVFLHNESVSNIRELKVMNDRRDFELTACDKNIEIRPEAVMSILVCSTAAFSFSTALMTVTLLHEKDLFLSLRQFQRIS